ncbi:hypothetical protein CBOM_08094 [Ceraceosorus bombacis]|uniref:Uncharacterized protein n=1 Tax=Ceraceosorus bombacis TaxID=401625 RepID=A0A0P1BKR5_9BASI|nr:hypothetical protein CBOM_08094 [Ceraceosorus bombacis]
MPDRTRMKRDNARRKVKKKVGGWSLLGCSLYISQLPFTLPSFDDRPLATASSRTPPLLDLCRVRRSSD